MPRAKSAGVTVTARRKPGRKKKGNRKKPGRVGVTSRPRPGR